MHAQRTFLPSLRDWYSARSSQRACGAKQLEGNAYRPWHRSEDRRIRTPRAFLAASETEQQALHRADLKITSGPGSETVAPSQQGPARLEIDRLWAPLEQRIARRRKLSVAQCDAFGKGVLHLLREGLMENGDDVATAANRLGRLRQQSGIPLSPACRALLDALIPFAGEMAGNMNARSLAMTVWGVARIASLEEFRIPPLPIGKDDATRSWDAEDGVGASHAVGTEEKPQPSICSTPAGSIDGDAPVATMEGGPSGSWSRAAETAEEDPSSAHGTHPEAVNGHAHASPSSSQNGAGRESGMHTLRSSIHTLDVDRLVDSSADEDKQMPQSHTHASLREGMQTQPGGSSSELSSEQPTKDKRDAQTSGEVRSEDDAHPIASTSGRESESSSEDIPQLVAPQARRRVLRRKSSIDPFKLLPAETLEVLDSLAAEWLIKQVNEDANAHSLTNMLWGFARLGYSPLSGAFFANVQERAIALAPTMAAQNICNIFWAYGELRQGLHSELSEALAARLLSLIPSPKKRQPKKQKRRLELKAEGIPIVLLACSRLRISPLSGQFFHEVLEAMTHAGRLKLLTPEGLTNLIVAVAAMGHAPPDGFLEQWAKQCLCRIESFQIQETETIVLACFRLRIQPLHGKLLTALFAVYPELKWQPFLELVEPIRMLPPRGAARAIKEKATAPPILGRRQLAERK